MASLRYLDPAQVRAWLPPAASHPRVEILGERTILAALVKRSFPLSEPDRFLSIQESNGTEVGVLKTTNGLESETARIFSEQLDRRYFTPRILHIDSLRQEAGMWRFSVQTQRGATEFFVRNWRDSANEIAPGRWQIHSVDGGRFEIENLEAMDATSRRLMDQLL